MGYVLVKGVEGAGVGLGATPGGLSPLITLPQITGFQDEFPDAELKEKYGRAVLDGKGKVTGHEYNPGERSIGTAAERAHKWGNSARYGIAGLAAMNALYNQTSSGQPGVLAPTIGGAYTGFAASSGLGTAGAEYAAAREDRRLNNARGYGKVFVTGGPRSESTLAEPTQIPEERQLGAGGYTEMTLNPSTGVYEEGAADTALANEYGDPMDPAMQAIRRNMGG